ncbi:protein LAX PANICLE 2-like [Cucurbita pepo subsp. pepo]|uniref:protein LAX PANICLE 2-like n=1 Tax=Cucurbita pepo subsp. pepo TaxID=3664 RepID=UPI000C9D8EB5|nr:protein LAX PANICLE 2-like [Cucurbita pepo subsp. pepo]
MNQMVPLPPPPPPPPPPFPFPLMNHFQPFHNNSNNNSLDHHHHHHHLFPLQHHPTTTNQTPSASKDRPLHDTPDEGWLRLSIGAATPDVVVHRHRPQPPGFRFGLTELDLLSPAGLGSKGHESSSVGDSSPGMVLAQPPPELNWTFRPISSHNPSSSNCSSSSLPYGPYFSTPFQLHPGLDLVAAATTAAAAGPSSDNNIRVIDPPRRPHSGIWFSLQASESNQGKQPALPQRSSYLRIKDGRMTVRLLIKYLVKKLRLDKESEIEIRCRGEKVEGCLTMQHVRDTIWCSKDSTLTTLLPNSSTMDHIMVLHYAILPTPHSSSLS